MLNYVKLAHELDGLWQGKIVGNNGYHFELIITRRMRFEFLDMVNRNLVTGKVSMEFHHGIWYIILTGTTEIIVFTLKGKFLKNNHFIFRHHKNKANSPMEWY